MLDNVHQILLFYNPFFLVLTEAHQRQDDVELVEKDGDDDKYEDNIGTRQKNRVYCGFGVRSAHISVLDNGS